MGKKVYWNFPELNMRTIASWPVKHARVSIFRNTPMVSIVLVFDGCYYNHFYGKDEIDSYLELRLDREHPPFHVLGGNMTESTLTLNVTRTLLRDLRGRTPIRIRSKITGEEFVVEGYELQDNRQ